METSTIGLTIRQIEELQDQYVVVTFDKTEPFQYEAGTHGVFELTTPLKQDKQTRVLTFMSHPEEDVIQVAFLKREPLSEYKETLLGSKKGDLVRLNGPFGGFTWTEDDKAVIIVTNGIGVSVLFSLLKENRIEKAVKIIDTTPKKHVFQDQLQALVKKHPTVDIAFGVSIQDAKKELETFRNNSGGLYYVSGIMPFLNDMTSYLSELGVEDDAIRLERYKGYTE